MREAIQNESKRVLEEIGKKYDNNIARHSDLIDEIVRSRKRELIESQELFEKANNNCETNIKRMNEMNSQFDKLMVI